tara:strand:+ start:1161 stop:1490 length:330 start_codon:yes stop_codon:yes gene_type:complete
LGAQFCHFLLKGHRLPPFLLLAIQAAILGPTFWISCRDFRQGLALSDADPADLHCGALLRFFAFDVRSFIALGRLGPHERFIHVPRWERESTAGPSAPRAGKKRPLLMT